MEEKLHLGGSMANFLVLIDFDPNNSDKVIANQLLIQLGLVKHFQDEHGTVRSIPGGGYGASGNGDPAGLRNHVLGALYSAGHWVSSILVSEIGPTVTGQHGQEPGPRPMSTSSEKPTGGSFVDKNGRPKTMEW